MYGPRPPTLAAIEQKRKTICNDKELHVMRDDTEKKEHVYPVMSQFNQAVSPISPVGFV